jgi:hypothetical protein
MANGRGRDKRREAFWRRIIRKQGSSGLSIREFCRKGKLPETAFYFWRSELARRHAEREQPRPTSNRVRRQVVAVPAFVPVQVKEDEESSAGGRPNGTAYRIEVELSGGRRVHVTAPVDRQALADVLAVLEGRPC